MLGKNKSTSNDPDNYGSTGGNGKHGNYGSADSNGKHDNGKNGKPTKVGKNDPSLTSGTGKLNQSTNGSTGPTKPGLNLEQLREMARNISADPDSINNLDNEELNEIYKYLNPIGGIVSSKKLWVTMTLINWREKYMRKLQMTALVGYVFRLCDEYEPEEDIELANQIFTQESKGLSNEDLVIQRNLHNVKNDLRRKTARQIVRRFLESNFNYNPDKHVKAAHSENPKDPERTPKDELVRNVCKVAAGAEAVEAKLQAKPEAVYQYMRSSLETTYQAAVEASAAIKSVLMVRLDPTIDAEDKESILFKKYVQLTELTEDLKKIVEPIAASESLYTLHVNPPTDVFHQFDRYFTNHFEQISKVVQSLYNEKPDVEYLCTIHNVAKTEDAAKNFRVQHADKFRNDVITIDNTASAFIGPYKENRQRIEFYNKNTEVMKRMIEQMEYDHKLGGDLMAKVVSNKKKKNIAEAGPDAPGLAQYSKSMNTVSELGAKKILSREDQEKLAEAKSTVTKIADDYEVPDNAIRVDMFIPKEVNGVMVLEKSAFFSQAEKPTFMQDDSRMNEEYQPVNLPDAPLKYKTQVITSKTGEKKEIRVAVGPA